MLEVLVCDPMIFSVTQLRFFHSTFDVEPVCLSESINGFFDVAAQNLSYSQCSLSFTADVNNILAVASGYRF